MILWLENYLKSYNGAIMRMSLKWNEVFSDLTIASAILDRIYQRTLFVAHCTVVSIKGESYRLKERKEFIKSKDKAVNTLFDEPNSSND